MRISTIKIIFYIAIIGLFLIVAPHVGLAENPGNGITNPLGNPDQTITDVLTNIIKWMLGLVGFLALIALIIGGGRMMIDFGNEEQVKKAKTTVVWAVIGLAVVILSYAILNIVTKEILGGGGSNGNYTSGGSGTGF